MMRLKQRVYEILTEPHSHDTFGRFIHLSILALIAVNVVVGIFETVPSLHAPFYTFFYWFEAISVGIFTVEYLLRLWACTSQPEFQHPLRGRWRMIKQPMTLIDLLAIAPFYLQFFFPGMDLRFIRILRLFRLFRLFRMGRLTQSIITLSSVFRRKKDELYMACIVLFTLVVFAASLMYLAEHNVPDSKFTSVPASMWWAIVTVTTIGYGDMVPSTPIGQLLGAVIGFLGVCVFALPIAIIGAGFIEAVDPEFQLHPVQSNTPSQPSSSSSVSSSSVVTILPDTPESPSSSLSHHQPQPHSWFNPPSDDNIPFPAALPKPTTAPTATLGQQASLTTIDPALLDAIAERVAHKLAPKVADIILAKLSHPESIPPSNPTPHTEK